MGQQPNKYHISNDGKVFRINEDGSFTSVGNVEDLERKPSDASADRAPSIPHPPYKPAGASECGWWKHNYNRLWVTTLVVFFVWFISCLSCSEFQINYWYDDHYEYDYESYFIVVLEYSFIILLSYAISWFFSSRTKVIFKWIQIAIIIFAIWLACIMLWHIESSPYVFLLRCLAVIPFSAWIVTLCLTIFRRRYHTQE